MNIQDENRRHSSDKWVAIARIFAIIGWFFFIIAMIISSYAAPDKDYGLLRYHNIDIRKVWSKPLTGYLYAALWFSALSSFFYLIIEKFRRRRKTDNRHYNVLLLLIITIAWVVYIKMQLS